MLQSISTERKQLLKQTLVAQALGDAFGYIIEFNDWDSIRSWYDDTHGLQYDPTKLSLVVSDDTQMTLFCLNGIVQNTGDVVKSIFDNYIDWYTTQTTMYTQGTGLLQFKKLFSRQAPGMTCLSSLSSGYMGTLSSRANNSKGCGGIMRTMPVAFYAEDFEEAFTLGAQQAAITHGHDDGIYSSAAYSAVLYLMLNETSLINAIDLTKHKLLNIPEASNIVGIIDKTVDLIYTTPHLWHDDLTRELGEGWVGDEALAIALYCAATSSSFKEVIEKSANHSGDSDSTAMLATGLWFMNTRNASFMDDQHHLDISEIIDYICG